MTSFANKVAIVFFIIIVIIMFSMRGKLKSAEQAKPEQAKEVIEAITTGVEGSTGQ